MKCQVAAILGLLLIFLINTASSRRHHKHNSSLIRRRQHFNETKCCHRSQHSRHNLTHRKKCSNKVHSKNVTRHENNWPGAKRGGAHGRSFSMGGPFGIHGGAWTDPLLESSRHYSLGIPFHVGGSTMLPQFANFEFTEFTFRMCDDYESQNFPIVIEHFDLEFPAKIPGRIKVNYKITTAIDVEAPIEVEVEGFKSVLGVLIKWPCTIGLGSCVYSDGCQIFRYSESGGCPLQFQQSNIPCDCPYPKGTYVAKGLEYNLFLQGFAEVPGPTFITDGNYFVKTHLKKHGQVLTCFQFSMTVRSV